MKENFKASGNILCLGSIIMDISVKCPQFPRVGETKYTPYSYDVTPGGKGANQAVAAARLGGKVKMLGRIATDAYGQELEENLKRDGIDVSALIRDPSEKSGVAFVWVDEAGRNQIICSAGVNNKNRAEDMQKSLSEVKAGDIVMLTMEFAADLIMHVAKCVKEKGGFVIFDPSGGDYDSLTPQFLSCIDMMKPNEVEAERITGIQITDEASMERAIQALDQKGVTYPLISLGEKGVIYKNDGKIVRRPGVSVKAVDTTAAGDTFIGAFAAKLSQGGTLEAAVDYGNLAASICVQRKGAQAAIPFAGELNLHNYHE